MVLCWCGRPPGAASFQQHPCKLLPSVFPAAAFLPSFGHPILSLCPSLPSSCHPTTGVPPILPPSPFTPPQGPRMVRDVFRLAKQNAPAIIFVDEVDAIATARFDAQTGADRRAHRV